MLKLETGYYRHAFEDLKNSPHWFGRLCVLALISLIPIFGMMVVYGYVYGWARDLAWDIKRPQSNAIFGNEDGKLLSRGALNWVIAFIYGIIPGIIIIFLQMPGLGFMSFADAGGLAMYLISLVSMLLLPGILSLVLDIVFTILSQIAMMRSSIYQDFGSAFQLGQIWKMIKHDTNGLLRIAGFRIIAGLVLGGITGALILVGIIMGVLFGMVFGSIHGAASGAMALLGIMFVVLLVLACIFFTMVYAIFVVTISARMMGYWVRQFRVAEWGASSDPLPFERDHAYASPQYPAAVNTAAPVADPAQTQGASCSTQAQSYSQPAQEVPAQGATCSTQQSCSDPVSATPVTCAVTDSGHTQESSSTSAAETACEATPSQDAQPQTSSPEEEACPHTPSEEDR